MNTKRYLLAAAIASAVLGSAAASAATSTASMPVTITIQKACDVSSTAPTTLNFGTQGLLTANVDNTAVISVVCTPTTTYSITLDGGTSGNVASRGLTVGNSGTGSSVGYQLYSDSARTHVWGLTGNNVSETGGTGSGSLQTFTVYGRVPAQSTPAPATYSDAVAVTVTY